MDLKHCDMCEGPCEAMQPERVAKDLEKLHRIVDYVMGQDPYATILIRRCPGDHEFVVQVQCDDPAVAERVNVSRELSQPGVWAGASSRAD